MAFRWSFGGAVLAAGMALLAILPAAQAQIIQLGGSDAEIRQMLYNQGFDRIDIVERGLSGATYQACRGAERLQFKVYWDGRISGQQRIGACRIQVGPDQVRELLRARGYERISIEERGGTYLAVGCIRGDRVRVEVTMTGDIGRERVLGRCEPDFTPVDIQAMLEAEGWDRIEIVDRRGQRVQVVACFENRRFELTMTRSGEVLERRRAGDCARALTIAELPAVLEQKGYERAVVIDPRLPRYKAEACRRGDRLELTVNRFGEILNEVKIGRCSPPARAEDISEIMRRDGYSSIKVVDNGDKGYVATGCKANRREEFLFSRYAEILKQRDLGRCTSASVQELADALRAEGVDRVQFYAEGCRGNRRVRIQYDSFGQETGRERVGPC